MRCRAVTNMEFIPVSFKSLCSNYACEREKKFMPVKVTHVALICSFPQRSNVLLQSNISSSAQWNGHSRLGCFQSCYCNSVPWRTGASVSLKNKLGVEPQGFTRSHQTIFQGGVPTHAPAKSVREFLWLCISADIWYCWAFKFLLRYRCASLSGFTLCY